MNKFVVQKFDQAFFGIEIVRQNHLKSENRHKID